MKLQPRPERKLENQKIAKLPCPRNKENLGHEVGEKSKKREVAEIGAEPRDRREGQGHPWRNVDE